MKRFERSFPSGYIRPLRRGVTLTDDKGETKYLDDIVEEMVEESEYSPSGGSDLKNVHIIVEIESAEKS